MPSPLRLLLILRRRLLVHRRGLAALCAVGAVALGLRVAAPAPAPTVGVWTARADLASGRVLRVADFRRTAYLPASVPDGAISDLGRIAGRTLITPLGRGDPITATQVLGAGRLAGYPGRSAVAVRIPDATLGALLRSGDRIDLLATDPRDAAAAHRVAQDAIVLTVPPEPADASGITGRLVVLAVAPAEIAPLAEAGAAGFLTVIWDR
jgi:pilus assembly protein CpaB